jgi:hypothetical protein
MLSLAKIALMASNEEPNKAEEEISTLNVNLDLVSYQEELPEIVLSFYGYDVERVRVLTPTELVKVRGQVFLNVKSIIWYEDPGPCCNRGMPISYIF